MSMSINIQKIVEMCKKQKRLDLLLDPDTMQQWISDGYAMYPLLGLPMLTEENIRAMYALPEGVRVEVKDMHEAFSTADVEPHEKPVFYEKIQLQPCIESVITLRTSRGVVFIRGKHLKPLEAGENGETQLYERVSRSGNLYIAAKQGMMLEAIIMPMQNVLGADWLDDMQRLLADLRQTFEREEKK